MDLDDDIDSLAPTSRCDCLKPVTIECFEAHGRPPIVPCRKRICHVTCSAHRHEGGTMSYVQWEGRTDWKGDAPDGPGVKDWLLSWWRRNFHSPQQLAQRTWDEMQKNFPPPAPLPRLQLLVKGEKFESRGTRMVPGWSYEVRQRGGYGGC